jgi:hypothetical protein
LWFFYVADGALATDKLPVASMIYSDLNY